MEEEMSLNSVGKGKNKVKILLIVLIVLIALLVGLFIGYKKVYQSKPILVYKGAVNNVYQYLDDQLKESEKESLKIDVKKDAYALQLNGKVETSLAELKPIHGYQLEAELGLDYKNEKVYGDIHLLKENKSLLKGEILGANLKAYLKLEELKDKVIDLGAFRLKDYLNLDELNLDYDMKSMREFLQEMKEILIASFDNHKFETTKEKIILNDKEVSVNKINYVLDQENARRTVEFILDEMVKKESILKFLAEVSGESKEMIKDSLMKAKEEANYDDYKTVYLTLYVKGVNHIVAGSLNNGKEELIKFTNYENKVNVKFDTDDVDIEINGDKKAVEVKVIQNNTELVNLKFHSGEKLDVDFSINVDNETYMGNVVFSYKKDSEKKMSGEFSIKIDYSQGNLIKVTGDYALELKDIPEFNTANSVTFDELNEEDLAILEKLITNFGN